MKKIFWLLIIILCLFNINVIFAYSSFDIACGSSMSEEFSCRYIKLKKASFKKNKTVVIQKENEKLHKRIVAVEGDVVEVTKNEIVINGEVFAQITFNSTPVEKTYHLQKDEFFVLGDNYHNSYDSKYFGPIEKKDIIAETEYFKSPIETNDLLVQNLNFMFFTLRGLTTEKFYELCK